MLCVQGGNFADFAGGGGSGHRTSIEVNTLCLSVFLFLSVCLSVSVICILCMLLCMRTVLC